MRRTVPLLASLVAAVFLALAIGIAVVATLEPAQAAFPGTNGKIVFASNRHGGWEIYTISPARNNLKRLTDNSATNVTPSWSADGKRIAFSSGGEAFASHDIFVMNANGSGRTLVTNERKIPGRAKRDYAPSFSPNGHRIAFLRARNIYTIRTDGSDLTRVTNYGSTVTLLSGPAWSPDGSKILFGSSSMFGDFRPELATASPDGSNHSVFAYPDVGNYVIFGALDWSPDGSRVVFDAGSAIYETVEGGEATRLTTNQAYADAPAYSPGGGKIVYSGYGDGDLYIKNADGTGKTQRLTNAPGVDDSPSWQPIH